VVRKRQVPRADVVVAQQAIRQTPGQQPTQPVAAPTGLAYGEHQQLTDAQHAVPLPAGAPSPAVPPAAAPSAGGSSAPAGGFDQALAAASAHPPPTLPSLSGPSQRPWEPTTHGLPSGPGAGPEVMGGGQPTGQKVSELFLGMYQQTGNAEWARQAQKALAQGR
jgi:hypothetical protein